MSTKKKWTLFLIFALFVVALSTSCDSQGKTPAGESGEDTTPLTSESLSQGVLDINYVNNFEGLISILNSVAEKSMTDVKPADGSFSLLGMIELGTISYTSFTDKDNYSYSADFTEQNPEESVMGVEYKITGTSSVEFEKVDGDVYSLSLSVSNATPCVIDVKMSDQTLLSATLDKSCALTDTGVTVEDRTYDSDEATLYGTIADIISEAITYNEETSSVEGVTLSYDAGSSTLTGTWDTHSVSVVVSSNSGTTSIESVIYDGIDLNHSVIDEFNAPSIYISEMLETIIGALG